MSDFPVEKIEQKVRAMRKSVSVSWAWPSCHPVGVAYGTEEANEIARRDERHINHGSKAATTNSPGTGRLH